jgi:hypothetical protein
MSQDTTETTTVQSVESAWATTLRAELPLSGDVEARKYANFLFGNPLFTMTDPDPQRAVLLVDELLDRHRPMAFFGVEGALTTEEWAALKERLVARLVEGVEGERPGPASAFPDAPALEETAESPATPETPAGTPSPAATAAAGLADEAVDAEGLTMTGLYDHVSEVVAAADLDAESVERALKRVIDDLDDHDEGE